MLPDPLLYNRVKGKALPDPKVTLDILWWEVKGKALPDQEVTLDIVRREVKGKALSDQEVTLDTDLDFVIDYGDWFGMHGSLLHDLFVLLYFGHDDLLLQFCVGSRGIRDAMALDTRLHMQPP
ncbi:hypothetical protein Droror1_Dr00017956 [Drosera rotundifolia]